MSEIKNTYVIRPIVLDDADALLDLIRLSSGGLSSLQPRLDFLKNYIEHSQHSFSGILDVETPHKYLLGMFKDTTNQLIGCAAVKTQIGKDTPFINFDLKGDGADEYLIASSRYTGATEVGSLFLHPDYRRDGLGRYLAKMRYLLIGSEPWRFSDTVIAELRGICGPEGSPLYDHLFEYKLDKSFLEADREYYDRNPDALGDIVPIGKLQTRAFPKDVRASIGQPHPTGIGAMRLLQDEGFIFSGTIDLFDAGPIMSVYRDTIRTLMNTKSRPVCVSPNVSTGQTCLICTGNIKTFRAVVTQAVITDDDIFIRPQLLNPLQCTLGAEVRVWRKNTSSQIKPDHTLVRAHS